MADLNYQAPDLLLAEIKRRDLTRAAAATQLGLQPSSLHHYTVTRIYRPKAELREKIAAWSEGRVPAESWLTPDERDAIVRAGEQATATDSPPVEDTPGAA